MFSRALLPCAVADCTAGAGDSGVLCVTHAKKVAKQRMGRVYLWRDRLRSDPKQADPAHATWVTNYEYAVRSAVSQAVGEPVRRHRRAPIAAPSAGKRP